MPFDGYTRQPSRGPRQVPTWPAEIDPNGIYRNAAGLWLLNQPGRALDLSGHNNHGTLVGGPTMGGGPYGPAMSFNGTTNAISIPLDLSAYSVITLIAQLYVPAGFTTTGIAVEFTANGYGGTDGGFAWAINDPSSGKMSFGLGETTSKTWSDSVLYARGSWHSYLCVYDRATPALTIMVDGAATTQTTIRHDAVSYGNFANDTLHVMARNSTSLFGQGTMGALAILPGNHAARAAQFAAAPFAGMRPLARRLYSAPAAVPASSGVQFIAHRARVPGQPLGFI